MSTIYEAAAKGRRSTKAITEIGRRCAAFTLVELLTVLVILGLLAAFAAPVVTGSLNRGKEAALKENLHVLRKAIDDYYADNGAYPTTLATLVEKRYVRNIPGDPVASGTEDMVWQVEFSDDGKGIRDVRSRSEKYASDGSRYDTW